MRRPFSFGLRATAAACAAATLLAGCSALSGSGDNIDYRSKAGKTRSLEVPPDLTQLARDSRYQPQAGTISASTLQQPAAPAAAASAPAVAPAAVGDLRVERDGRDRWLSTALPPDALWPQLRAFWQERGFTLVQDNADIGVMETDWAENRAKLPQDGVRRLLGGVLNNFYDTGLRDRFRTRVERTARGSDVFITHRGLEEVQRGTSETTVWTWRDSDSELEAEMLARLMVKLGVPETPARAQVAASTAAPQAAARARSTGQGTMEVDESFDRAWRRVGLALDRGGFTVEDRDRASGLYFVRYVDPKTVGQEGPGFFARLFGAEDTTVAASRQRYRVSLKAAGTKTTVMVLNAQGAAEQGEVGQRIVALLVDELK